MSSDKRELLLDGYLQGNLDDVGFNQLLELLRRDPTAVKRLVELSLLESGLVYMGREEGLLQNTQIDQLTAEAEELPTSFMDDIAPKACDIGAREAIRQRAERQLSIFLAEQERLRQKQRISSQRSSLDITRHVRRFMGMTGATVVYTEKFLIRFCAASLFLLVLAAAYQYHVSHQWVATLEKTTEAVWLEAPEQRSLYPGERVLQEGYIEILFRSGARIIVEAPSRFQLVSPKRMTLEQGKVTTQVPPEANGFTVASKAVEIKDLGTEFGVKVGPGGSTETAVFKGLVELTGSDRALREKRRIEENEQVFASAQGRLGKTKTLGLYHDFRRSWDDVMYLPKVSGRMRVLRQTPLDLRLDQLESSGWIFVVPERRNVLLTEDLAGIVTGSGLIKDEDTKGVLPAGSRVDTYLLHFDPLGEAKIQIPVAGTIRFARPILGVICTDATIIDSGVLLGAPGVRYTEDKFGQGIESDMKAFSDRVIIHEDRRSLSVALSITGGVMDQIRILVEAVPSP